MTDASGGRLDVGRFVSCPSELNAILVLVCNDVEHYVWKDCWYVILYVYGIHSFVDMSLVSS